MCLSDQALGKHTLSTSLPICAQNKLDLPCTGHPSSQTHDLKAFPLSGPNMSMLEQEHRAENQRLTPNSAMRQKQRTTPCAHRDKPVVRGAGKPVAPKASLPGASVSSLPDMPGIATCHHRHRRDHSTYFSKIPDRGAVFVVHSPPVQTEPFPQLPGDFLADRGFCHCNVSLFSLLTFGTASSGDRRAADCQELVDVVPIPPRLPQLPSVPRHLPLYK